jgi:hypothetical protein
MQSIITLSLAAALAVAGACSTAACGGGNSPPDAQTPGADRTGKTATLETGASVMQAKAPVEKIAMYLDGFHAAKDDPQMQMESHHYCNQVNEDFAQCVLFDANTPDARLHGVEYIISAVSYGRLPAGERAYWHPHNYEILSGELRMPGLPDVAEKEALKSKINSYGKTWHFWMTGTVDNTGDDLPVGPPHLAWSFNRDGEMRRDLLVRRDERMRLDTTRARQQRADLTPLAQPQGGVGALSMHFPGATPLPGVVDNADAATKPVPTVVLR